jgi:hypothetical protein
MKKHRRPKVIAAGKPSACFPSKSQSDFLTGQTRVNGYRPPKKILDKKTKMHIELSGHFF